HLRMIGIEHWLRLVSLLASEAEEVLDRRGAVDTLLPLRRRLPRELRRIRRPCQGLTRLEQCLHVDPVVDDARHRPPSLSLSLSLRNLIFLNESQTIPVGGSAEQAAPAVPASAPAPGSVRLGETQYPP